MNREGQGDKLAHIAAEERLPATQVRQRVSRMRRRLRQSWMREMAAVAAVTLLALMWWQSRSSHEEQPVAPRPDPERVTPLEPSVSERARRLRAEAFEQCEREAWSACRDKLDEAKQLEPSGERLDTVAGARRRRPRCTRR